MSQAEPVKLQNSTSVLHTAIYISKIVKNEQSSEDLKQLLQMASKPNSGVRIYADEALTDLLGNGIIYIQNGILPSEVKAVLPLTLPLQNEPQQYFRWLNNVAKIQTNQTVVVANGVSHAKAGYFEKWCGYWANFWPKLFTGSNSNLAGCKAILLSKEQFENIFIGKKIEDAWQIAAIAEKENKAVNVNFEMAVNSFVFGDGVKAFFAGFGKGITAIINSFFKLATIKSETSSWMNLNHSGYKRVFGIAAALLLVLMCWISFDYNVTWDEPNHNTFSKDVLKYYSSFGSDTTMFDFQKQGHRDYYTNVFYGMSIDVWASAINSIFDIKNEYATRHFMNALIGFLCILFTALIVRRLGGWLPGLIALVAMVCSPSFFGHCFNNPKDIPFATGYIMSVYYLIKLLLELPNVRHQTKVMLAIAIGFAISIRVQGILPIAYLFMFVGLYWLLNELKTKNKNIIGYLKLTVIIAIAGYSLGILFWPYALRDPLSAPFTALKEFEKFSYLTYYELFEGVRIFEKPWYYEPKLIMLTAPLAVIAGFGLGLLLGFFKKDKKTLLAVALLLFATVFPSGYTIYKKSYVYNGWRHFIFIYPSLVALSVLGWVWLVQWFKSDKLKYAILMIVAITFLKPGIWSIINHPYQYIYFNEIAGGVKGANGVYEIDYWNQSPRAAFEWLVKNKPEVLKGDLRVNSNNIQEALKTFVPEGKDVQYKWTREYEWANDDWTYAIWTTRTLSKNQILGGYWPPKGTVHEIKVDGVTIAAVVKSANNYSFMAKQYLNKNNGDSALLFYEKAFAYNPLEEEYARGMANALRLKMQLDSSIMFFKKALSLRDGNYEALQSLGELYYYKAMRENQQNPDKKLVAQAFENLSLAFKYKKNTSAPLMMGEIKLADNQAEEARDYFYKFLETYSNEGRGYLGLAKAQIALGESDSALMNLDYACQLDTKNPEPFYLMGSELKKRGKEKEAEQYFQQYAKLSGMPTQ